MRGVRGLLIELRRRRVFRVAGMFIVVSWVGVQVASLVFPAIDVTDAAIRFVWLGFLLVFPLVMVFAWRYDLSPDGIVRTLPAGEHSEIDLRLRSKDYVILAALLGVVFVMGYQVSEQIRSFNASSPDLAKDHLDRQTIVVLPFENISGDPSQDYFVDGMHDAMISVLSGISALKVISRTSTRNYAISGKSLLEIGQGLGAANIIEGSVVRDNNNVRISVHLIDAASGLSIWANVYEREISDVLRLQSELASAIAGEVRVLMTPEESAYLASAQEVSPQAYESYLKGRFHWYRFGENDLAIALDYFRSAIEIDTEYALAYVGYADALVTPAHIGLLPPSEVFPKAVELVDKALELDPLLAEAHDFEARISFVWDHDWLAADRGFRESIRLKANYPDARIVYSQFLGIQERWDESLEQVRAGLRLDPFNNWFRIELGARLSWMGNYDDALNEYLAIAADQPNWFMIYRYLWEAYFYLGELDTALASARTYYELLGDLKLAEILSGFDGETGFSDAMLALAQEMEARGVESYVSEFELARLYAFAGDTSRTIVWLERAEDNRDSQLVYSIADPLFRLARDHSRFAELRAKMNLPSKP